MRAWTSLSLLCALACTDPVRAPRPTECDPVADEGCPTEQRCRVVAGGGTACLAQEMATETCTAGSCEPGEACLRAEGFLTCRRVCLLDDDGGCPGACGYAFGAGSPYGACAEPCTLGDCAAGATCAPVPERGWPVCVAAGPAEAGDDCAQTRCAQGLACLALDETPRCIAVCDPESGAPCPNRCSGVIEGVGGLGYCI